MTEDWKEKFKSKKKQVVKEREEKVSAGRRLLDAAEEFIATHEHSIVASDDTDEVVSLYLKTKDNLLLNFNDKQLESSLYRLYPELMAKNTKELMRMVKLEAFTKSLINLESVQPVAFADEPTVLTWNRLTLKRSDLGTVKLDSVKAFSHILSLCDDPRALVLWIGSLLDPAAGRAQYLHLHGGGGNGKSTLFSGIGHVLGERYVVTTRADEFSNQHWGSIVEGARLLIFPDENNPGFFSTGKFKEFTGEDSTSVNPKYEKPRRIRLTHKTAVFSNNRVEISSSAADRRRLLSVSMQDDPDQNVGFRWWYDELKNSGAQILAYCYGEYEAAVRADPSVRAFIPQNPEVINAAIARKYADVTEIILDLYAVTKDPAHSLPQVEVHDAILDRLKERRSARILMQQVREALRHLGVRASDDRYYGLKLASKSGGLSLASLPKVVT